MCNKCTISEFKPYIVTTHNEQEIWAKSSSEAIEIVERDYSQDFEGNFEVKEIF